MSTTGGLPDQQHADFAYFPLTVSRLKILGHFGAVRGLQPPESRVEETRREGVSVQCWRLGGRSSDPWNDVGHKVSVDPVDDACIHVSHLAQRRNLWVPGSAITLLLLLVADGSSIWRGVAVHPSAGNRYCRNAIGACVSGYAWRSIGCAVRP